MASIRNMVAQDQGVNWVVTFEYSNDGQITWHEYEASFPGDLSKLPASIARDYMIDLGVEMCRHEGLID